MRYSLKTQAFILIFIRNSLCFADVFQNPASLFSMSWYPQTSEKTLTFSVLPEFFLLQYEIKNMQSRSLEFSLRYSLFLSEGVEESASDT